MSSLINKYDQFTLENSGFTPMRLLEIELSLPLQDISNFDQKTGRVYPRGLACIFLHHSPLGIVELKLGENGLPAVEASRLIWQALGPQINKHLHSDGFGAVTTLDERGIPANGHPTCLYPIEKNTDGLPFASVVICTRDHPESLSICLHSFRSMDYPNYEIILVDNAPATDATCELVKNSFSDLPQIRYIREDRPGLSVARNRGLGEVRGNIVAFTDDDVRVDRYWLKQLVYGFSLYENVACVTGLVFPAEFETPAQGMMEQFGGMGKGFIPQIFDLDDHCLRQPLYPYSAGWFGVGANMAYKTDILRRLDGFDPALGTGTPASGGEDLAMFFNIIVQGYQLVYWPDAFLYHYHRRTYAAFRKQAYGYGVGLTAYLTKVLLDRPSLVLNIVKRIPAGTWYLLSYYSQKNRKKQANYPAEINWLERKGMLAGPLAYLQSRRQARTYERQFGRKQMTAVSLPAQEGGSHQ